MTDKQALLLIRRFLSSLSWVEQGHLRETITFGTGARPGGVGKGPGARLISPKFRVDYLPDPTDPKARLCLALYREAMNLNSDPFQFLGFFKIINALYKTGGEQKIWINQTLPLLNEHSAIERLKELQKQHRDVGEYLYESGRCAVAHAFNEPLVDPDDPDDTWRLSADLPVIKALAEYLIENQVGVKSAHTYWKEHLYELAGFHETFGASIVAKLKTKQLPNKGEFPMLPLLSIRLRDKEPYPAFERLVPTIVGVEDGCVYVRCDSKDGIATLTFVLNFSAERIEFDTQGGVAVGDDGSAHAARVRLDALRFFREHIGNGELEIWNAEAETLLGRADPLIPMNVDLRGTIKNLERLREEMETVLAVRSAPEEGACSI
jgi:hypothetical protein